MVVNDVENLEHSAWRPKHAQCAVAALIEDVLISVHILTLKLTIFQNSICVGLALSLSRQGEAVSTSSYPGLLVKFRAVGPDGGIAEGPGARATRLALLAGPSKHQALCFGGGGSCSTLVFRGCQFSGQDVNSMESQYQDFQSQSQVSVSWVLL